jgi:hypothetical protein
MPRLSTCCQGINAQFPMETRAIGVSLGFSTPVSIFSRPCAASGNVADFHPGAPETELSSDLHRAAQPLRVDGDPVAQPARHSSTCAPGAACRGLRRHPGAGRCKPAAVRPKSLLWIDVPLRSRSREWLLLPRCGHSILRDRDPFSGYLRRKPSESDRRGRRDAHTPLV